jgi:hypothetical protein
MEIVGLLTDAGWTIDDANYDNGWRQFRLMAPNGCILGKSYGKTMEVLYPTGYYSSTIFTEPRS